MAGHSQFKNIMHRKGKQDKVRSKVFGKLAREITVAAKLGQPDPAFNPRLRAAILAARAENMPKDNIERAVKKATGNDSENFDDIRYEGYGPGGVAVIVEALTDNHNRTAGEVRSIFAKSGGNLGTTGSVAFQFHRSGELVFDTSAPGAEDKLLEAALDAGADDVQSGGAQSTVLCAPENFEALKKALTGAGFTPLRADVVWRPENRVAVPDEAAETLRDLIEWLEDLDDVQEVYHNAQLGAE